MKLLLTMLMFLSTSAYGYENGLRLGTESQTSYVELSGVRIDGDLYGAMGFFELNERTQGMKLSIGPKLFQAQDFQVFTLLNTSFSDVDGYTTWNELEFLSTYKWTGVSVARVYGDGREVFKRDTAIKLYLQITWEK